ncbi:DUF305 domain-containing protein [Streptomyces sp. 5.8]|uniref:DUF305 domain-containing protein n=1 Tax=Streptomyces sp. 5.8 TaxID=3406571 RepID=UPI003BB73975
MTTKCSLIRRATAVAAAATAALVLAACGGNGDSGAVRNGHNTASPSASAPAQQGDHNAADVTFAQGMIPHHRQAIEMADLAATRAGSPEVKKLADEIKKAQDPEVKTLSGWLASWGEQVPAEGEGHGGHDMSGMMTAEEMKQLESSSGKAFDTGHLIASTRPAPGREHVVGKPPPDITAGARRRGSSPQFSPSSCDGQSRGRRGWDDLYTRGGYA